MKVVDLIANGIRDALIAAPSFPSKTEYEEIASP